MASPEFSILHGKYYIFWHKHISDRRPYDQCKARPKDSPGIMRNSDVIMLREPKFVRSVEDFIKEISILRESWFPDDPLLPWCRGQERAEWDLVPKL